MKSKVYFTDFSVKTGDSLLKKFRRLIIEGGIDKIDFTEKYVAVKVHFGEYGNMSFLRHQYAKILCDYIKEKGGKPFLTDCNTLYVGARGNALDHLDCAYLNGYNPLSTGVQTIIADGLRGTDEREIPVINGEYVKKAKIGAAIAEADVIISLTHFKGHISTGFGGALKNIGMGSGSKKGKMEMHSTATPKVIEKRCVGCGNCVRHCANDGVNVVDGKAVIDEDKCLGCGYCLAYCPKAALTTKWDEAKPILCKKIAEYTKATLEGKPNFHISLIQDVSPECDCEGGNDIPLIPNIGMLCSFDPVALDQACVDMANKAPITNERQIKDRACTCGNVKDLFKMVHPDTEWQAGLIHAEKIELGTREYELVTL